MAHIVIKIVLIHLLLIPYYLLTLQEISLMPVEKLDTLLLFVGLIVIAPVTSNFIYKYKDAQEQKSKYWGHATTFLSMLTIGMLFIILDILLIEMIGHVLVFRLVIVLFWLAVISYDLADFLQLENKK